MELYLAYIESDLIPSSIFKAPSASIINKIKTLRSYWFVPSNLKVASVHVFRNVKIYKDDLSLLFIIKNNVSHHRDFNEFFFCARF